MKCVSIWKIVLILFLPCIGVPQHPPSTYFARIKPRNNCNLCIVPQIAKKYHVFILPSYTAGIELHFVREWNWKAPPEWVLPRHMIGSLSNEDDALRQRKQRKSNNRFRLAKEQINNSRFFVYFFNFFAPPRHAWNWLISRFIEDLTTRQRFSYSVLNFDTVLFRI